MKGMLVGLANALITAFCIALSIDRTELIEVTVLITMFAAIPAVFTGAILGHIGERLQNRNRNVLLVSMMAAAFTMVAFLGTIVGLPHLILFSCVPTAAGCSILERWTRAKPDEVFPAARVA